MVYLFILGVDACDVVLLLGDFQVLTPDFLLSLIPWTHCHTIFILTQLQFAQQSILPQIGQPLSQPINPLGFQPLLPMSTQQRPQMQLQQGEPQCLFNPNRCLYAEQASNKHAGTANEPASNEHAGTANGPATSEHAKTANEHAGTAIIEPAVT